MGDKNGMRFITGIVFSILFVYIYLKGFGSNGWAGGLKYGIIMSLWQLFIASYSQHIYPVPFILATQWFIFGIFQFVLCGLLVSVYFTKTKESQ